MMLISTLPACGTGTSAGQSNGNDGASGGTSSSQSAMPGTNERFASSFAEYIDQTVEQAQQDPAVSANQMALLKDAQQAGKVSRSDYESAWSNYKQCVVDQGQPEPVLRRYSNGVYDQAPIKGSEKNMSAFSAAMQPCNTAEVMYIDPLFKAQQDNPNLYKNTDAAVVDCLHRKDLVSKSYTAQEFDKESTSDKGFTSFDTHNPEVLACMAGNGFGYADVTDPNLKVQDLG